MLAFLCAPADVIRARKAELAIEEIERQLRFWPRQSARAKWGMLTLDTAEASPEELARRAWEHLSRGNP
jgi:hypothetical protein